MEKSERALLHSNIIYTFTLGVLWGLLEILASELLVPNNIFLKGLIFSFIAVLILIFSKRFIEYNFSLLIIAMIALLIISSSRGFSPNIMIAIFFEALIAEILFFYLKFRLSTSIAIGALIFLYSFIHGLVFHGSLPGSYIIYLYNNMFRDLFGIVSSDNVYFVLSFWGIISFILGLFAGWISWQMTIRFYQKTINKINTYFLTE